MEKIYFYYIFLYISLFRSLCVNFNLHQPETYSLLFLVHPWKKLYAHAILVHFVKIAFFHLMSYNSCVIM